MEPTHEVFTAGIPVLVVFAAVLFNREYFDLLQPRLDSTQGKMNSTRSDFHTEFRELYRTLGQHGSRLDHLDKR